MPTFDAGTARYRIELDTSNMNSQFTQVVGGFNKADMAINRLDKSSNALGNNFRSLGTNLSPVRTEMAGVQQSAGALPATFDKVGSSAGKTLGKVKGIGEFFRSNKGLIFGGAGLASAAAEAAGMMNMFGDAVEQNKEAQEALAAVQADSTASTQDLARAEQDAAKAKKWLSMTTRNLVLSQMDQVFFATMVISQLSQMNLKGGILGKTLGTLKTAFSGMAGAKGAAGFANGITAGSDALGTFHGKAGLASKAATFLSSSIGVMSAGFAAGALAAGVIIMKMEEFRKQAEKAFSPLKSTGPGGLFYSLKDQSIVQLDEMTRRTKLSVGQIVMDWDGAVEKFKAMGGKFDATGKIIVTAQEKVFQLPPGFKETSDVWISWMAEYIRRGESQEEIIKRLVAAKFDLATATKIAALAEKEHNDNMAKGTSNAGPLERYNTYLENRIKLEGDAGEKLTEFIDMSKNAGDTYQLMADGIDEWVQGEIAAGTMTEALGEKVLELANKVFPDFIEKENTVNTTIAGLNKTMGDGTQVWFPPYIMKFLEMKKAVLESAPPLDTTAAAMENLGAKGKTLDENYRTWMNGGFMTMGEKFHKWSEGGFEKTTKTVHELIQEMIKADPATKGFGDSLNFGGEAAANASDKLKETTDTFNGVNEILEAGIEGLENYIQEWEDFAEAFNDPSVLGGIFDFGDKFDVDKMTKSWIKDLPNSLEKNLKKNIKLDLKLQAKEQTAQNYINSLINAVEGQPGKFEWDPDLEIDNKSATQAAKNLIKKIGDVPADSELGKLKAKLQKALEDGAGEAQIMKILSQSVADQPKLPVEVYFAAETLNQLYEALAAAITGKPYSVKVTGVYSGLAKTGFNSIINPNSGERKGLVSGSATEAFAKSKGYKGGELITQEIQGSVPIQGIITQINLGPGLSFGEGINKGLGPVLPLNPSLFGNGTNSTGGSSGGQSPFGTDFTIQRMGEKTDKKLTGFQKFIKEVQAVVKAFSLIEVAAQKAQTGLANFANEGVNSVTMFSKAAQKTAVSVNTYLRKTIPVAAQASQTSLANLSNEGSNSLAQLSKTGQKTATSINTYLRRTVPVAAQASQTALANLSNEGSNSLSALAKSSSKNMNGLINNMKAGEKAVKSLQSAINSLKDKTVTVKYKQEGSPQSKGGVYSFAQGGTVSAAGGLTTVSQPTHFIYGDNPGNHETLAFIPHNNPGPIMDKLEKMFNNKGDGGVEYLQNITLNISGSEIINDRKLVRKIRSTLGERMDRFGS